MTSGHVMMFNETTHNYSPRQFAQQQAMSSFLVLVRENMILSSQIGLIGEHAR